MKCLPREMLVESQRVGDEWAFAPTGNPTTFNANDFIVVTLTTTATDRPKTYLTVPVRKSQITKYPAVGTVVNAEIFLR